MFEVISYKLNWNNRVNFNRQDCFASLPVGFMDNAMFVLENRENYLLCIGFQETTSLLNYISSPMIGCVKGQQKWFRIWSRLDLKGANCNRIETNLMECKIKKYSVLIHRKKLKTPKRINTEQSEKALVML
jgi:hypothetical protein